VLGNVILFLSNKSSLLIEKKVETIEIEFFNQNSKFYDRESFTCLLWSCCNEAEQQRFAKLLVNTLQAHAAPRELFTPHTQVRGTV
jgi:hypothetical protein